MASDANHGSRVQMVDDARRLLMCPLCEGWLIEPMAFPCCMSVVCRTCAHHTTKCPQCEEAHMPLPSPLLTRLTHLLLPTSAPLGPSPADSTDSSLERALEEEERDVVPSFEKNAPPLLKEDSTSDQEKEESPAPVVGSTKLRRVTGEDNLGEGLFKFGWLLKRGTGKVRVWMRRFFALKAARLYYYKTMKDFREDRPIKYVSLLTSSVQAAPEMDRRCCFKVVTLKKVYYYQAESEDDMYDWMHAITMKIQENLDGELLINTSDKRREESPALQKVWTIEGNRRCADCGELDPDWASRNLGLILCIGCSGVHRNLGSHISKIRSLVLDDWEPVSLRLILALGNVKANRVWEKNCGEWMKPGPFSEASAKEQWIRTKYEKRGFVEPFTLSPSEMSRILYDAVGRNDVEQAYGVLISGADVNWPGGGGRMRTPVHNAAAKGCVEALLLLLENGGKPALYDADGRLPIDVAIAGDHHACASLLKRFCTPSSTNSGGSPFRSFPL
eukprot:TRINITY_DN5448_c0_g1_i1.p1 TRINITY_DN5448_c0_g1~~TRINITY_DN5448_c0_g1_i1.p1  ORF type:complete len:518 (-),score=89.45 TRINITY_DN5448_c0_g1_i1:75-1580(-)